jgi:hypothetical protein
MRGESPVAGFSEIGFHPPSSACLKLKGPLKAVLVACRMPHAACAGAGLSLDVADALLDGREFSHFPM